VNGEHRRFLTNISFLVQAIMLTFRVRFNSFRRLGPHTLEGLGVAVHHQQTDPTGPMGWASQAIGLQPEMPARAGR
jgi:hypothetical protein